MREGGSKILSRSVLQQKINTRILLRRGGSLESRFLALPNVQTPHHTFKTIKNNQIKKN